MLEFEGADKQCFPLPCLKQLVDKACRQTEITIRAAGRPMSDSKDFLALYSEWNFPTCPQPAHTRVCPCNTDGRAPWWPEKKGERRCLASRAQFPPETYQSVGFTSSPGDQYCFTLVKGLSTWRETSGVGNVSLMPLPPKSTHLLIFL